MRKLFLVLALLFARQALAVNASPVAISTIAFASGVVTVNTSTAHGLLASLPSAFCISGSSTSADNVCGVVTTAPTSTQFTFALASGATCASSCGTVLPAKRAIWLVTSTVQGGYQVNYVLWLATTQPVAGRVSAWSGASTSENNALSSGSLIEVNRTIFFALGTTLAAAEAAIQQDWIAQQNALAASVQPGAFFGNFFDGSGWTQ